MTIKELLDYLAAHSPYPLLDGDAAETVNKARAGGHRDPLMGDIVRHLFEGAGGQGVDAAITRAQATTAVGPIRLRYMKDDAPVEGFRAVEGVVHAIDSAFNEEALRERQAGR